MNYKYEVLKIFSKKILKNTGYSDEHAEQASNVLLAADLRGVDSHGVARLSGYVRLWEGGRLNPSPRMRVVHETPSTAVLDGDCGPGLVTGPKAMSIAVDKAQNCGTGWVAVKNSNHFGIAGYHAELALPHDMIGIAMTNASPLVAPTFSAERLLGTNPIAVAIPAGKERPFVADLATAAAANGKLEILQRKGKSAPLGWIQDAEGIPSTSPDALQYGGALLPLGSDPEHGSHKGYALAALVDILSGVLSGANYGPWVPPFVSFLPLPANPVGEGIGHFLGALRIDAFRPAEEFKEHMDRWIGRFKSAKPLKGYSSVMVPGEPEYETLLKRIKEGIPLAEKVVEDLKKLAEKFSCSFPSPEL